MSEAIIVRRSAKSEKATYIRDIITVNSNWKMPSNVINNEVYVELIGAGGASRRVYKSLKLYQYDATGGGGSGYFNNGNFKINEGQIVPITIGNNSYTTGGTTSFGTYLSANGGSAGSSYFGTDNYNESIITARGGTGGSGGGCSIRITNYANSAASIDKVKKISLMGGDAYQFGGGGASVYTNNPNIDYDVGTIRGGDGGMYGGGGGAYCQKYPSQCYYGNGGKYGGNGGNISISAENGTNLSNMNISIFDDNIRFSKNGNAGRQNGGGGGYGGDGSFYNGGGGGGYLGSAGYPDGSGGGGYIASSAGLGGGGLEVSRGVQYGNGGSGQNNNGAKGVCVIYYYKKL